MEKSFLFRATDPKTPLGPNPFGVVIKFDKIKDFIPHPTYILYKGIRAGPLFLPLLLEVRSAEALLEDKSNKVPTQWKSPKFASIANGSIIIVKFGEAVKLDCTAIAYDNSVKKSDCESQYWVDSKGCKDQYVTTQVKGSNAKDKAVIQYFLKKVYIFMGEHLFDFTLDSVADA